MAEETVWINTSADLETRGRAETMAKEDYLSVSALVRKLINREWERRQKAASVSAETLPSLEVE